MLLRKFQLAPSLGCKDIREKDIGVRGRKEVKSIFNVVDFHGSPVRESRARQKIEVGPLPESSKMVKLYLLRLGQSASSSTIIPSSPSSANVQRAEPRFEVLGESHNVTALPGPDPATTTIPLPE